MLLGLFGLGLALAHTHLAMSLELSVTLSYHSSLVRSVMLLLYPVAVSMVGLGGVLERFLNADRGPPLLPDGIMRAAGLVLLVLLGVVLRVNFLAELREDLIVAAVANVAFLAAWYVLVGMAVVRLLRLGHAVHPRFVAVAWAAHLLGLVVGYATVDTLIYSVGVNAMLLCVALALMIAPRWVPLPLAICLVLAPHLAVDDQLEELRNVLPIRAGTLARINLEDQEGEKKMKLLFEGEEAFRGWSRFAQVRLTEMHEGGEVVLTGYYNFFLQFVHAATPTRMADLAFSIRQTLYSVAEPEDHVALIAVGAGRGVHAFDFPPHRGIVTVEMDDSVVRFLRDVRPDLNGGVFRDTTALAGDGRFVIETSETLYDLIIVESGRHRPLAVSDPVGAADTLYTREAIGLFMSRLSDDGYLMMNFAWVRPNRPEDEYHPIQVLETFDEEKIPFDTYSLTLPRADAHVFLVAARNPAALTRLAEHVAGQPQSEVVRNQWRPGTGDDPRHQRRLTDAQPFGHWARADDDVRHTIWWLAGALTLLVLAGVGLLAWRSRRQFAWPAVPYFFLIGVAHTAVQIGSFYAYRSFFGDGVTTTIHLIIWFTIWGAVGAFAARRVAAYRLPRGVVLGVSFAVLVLHLLLLQVVPFAWSNPVCREIAAALLLLPGGLLMGMFFPTGLMAVRDDAGIGRLVLADSAGTLCGYILFYLLFLLAGLDVYVAVAIGCYLVAAALLVAATPAGRPLAAVWSGKG